jgi:hypothetical protein
MTYKDHLNRLRALSAVELASGVAALCATCPSELQPWPVGMPASLDPKIILIGVSPGNSPTPGDTEAAEDWSSIPTVETPKDSHFYYPDGTRYWDKLKYLARQFCAREGTVSSERDALSLCSHFNLGTKRAGTANKNVVESDVIAWVSRLLNTVHNPDLVVLFGLGAILRDSMVAADWNCEGGLLIDWNTPHQKRLLSGYAYQYREWTVQNAQGHDVQIVLWPNHPSKHPFADMKVWKRSVDEYLGLEISDPLPVHHHAPVVRKTVMKVPTRAGAPGWGLTFGSVPGTAAMRVNCQLCDVPKMIAEICAGTAQDAWGPKSVDASRARDHLKWHLDGNTGLHPERRNSGTFVSGLMSPSPGRYCLPASMRPGATQENCFS